MENKVFCYYGCGNEGKYLNKSGKWMCDTHSTKCPINRKKNSEGGKKSHKDIANRKTLAKDIYSSLPQETKDRMAWSRGKFLKEFSKNCNKSGSFKNQIINERGYKCENCGIDSWLGKKLIIELDHVDGNNRNNSKENLKLLCPNCHSQTPTWKKHKINNKGVPNNVKVQDEDLINALKSKKNIRQALSYVGLTPKAGNYKRCYELIFKGKLSNPKEWDHLKY